MHSTKHSPTPREQIKRLFTILGLAIGCAIATVGLMLYTAPTEKSYALSEVLVAPETLPRIHWQEPSPYSTPSSSSSSTKWHFDKIVLSFVDPVTKKLTSRILSPSDYARLYAQLTSDSSLTEKEHLRLEVSELTSNEPSIELSVWLASDTPLDNRRSLQTVLFLPNKDLYRVQLYTLDHTLDASWATFHHHDLTSLLHPFTQEAP